MLFSKEVGEISNGSAYKKISNSCDISDYSFMETLNEAILDWEKTQKEYELGITKWNYTFDEAINWWRSTYERK